MFALIAVSGATAVWSSSGLFPVYLIVLLGICAFVTLPPSVEKKESGKALFWLVVLTILAFVTRYHGISQIPVWSDEDDHGSIFLRSRETFLLAAKNNRAPPLFYYMSTFSMLVFGENPFALRFFPALFGSLSVPIFFSLLRKTINSLRLTVAGTIAFIGQYYLWDYSKEGKPYTIGIFFLLLFCHALQQSWEKAPEWRSSVRLGACAFLLLVSMGLQPPVYFAALILAAAFLSVLRKEMLFRWQEMASIALAICASAPIHWLVVSNSGQFNRLSSSLIHANLLSPVSGAEFFSAHWELLEELELFWILLPVSFVSLARKPGRKFQAITVLLSLIIPALFFLTFRFAVNWGIQARYMILYVPMFLLSLFYAVEELGGILGKWRIHFFNVLLALMVFFSLILYPYKAGKKVVEMKWNDLYSYLETSAKSDSAAFVISLVYPAEFLRAGFSSLGYFSGAEELTKRVRLETRAETTLAQKNQTRLVLEALRGGKKIEHLYFFSLDREGGAELSRLRYPDSLGVTWVSFKEGLPGWGASLAELPVRGGVTATVGSFFRAVESQIEKPRLRGGVNEILAEVSMQNGNCRDAESRIRDYQELCRISDTCFNLEYLQSAYAVRCRAR